VDNRVGSLMSGTDRPDAGARPGATVRPGPGAPAALKTILAQVMDRPTASGRSASGSGRRVSGSGRQIFKFGRRYPDLWTL